MHAPHLKLGQRLALSYGAVIALLIAVALVGISMLADLSHTTDDALQDKYPKTILVNELINDLESIARAMRNTLFLNEPEQLQEQLSEINVTKLRMAQTLASLKKKVTDSDGASIFREIEIVNSAYIVNQEDFVSLVAEKRMGEAKNLLLVDLHPYQVQYFDLLHKLNRHQSKLMENASSEISQAYLSAKRMMLLLAGFAALLSILITVLITRSLLKQLGGEPDYAASVANKIAIGDLSSDIQIDKGDRSSLLYVMGTMRDKLLERTDALESANSELEAMVEMLKRTQDELVLSEKMAALGCLVAGVAHELNTPIGNGVMAASTLADSTNAMIVSIQNNFVKRSMLDLYFKEMQEGEEILLRNLSRASELVTSFKQVAVDRQTSQFRQFLLDDVVNEIILTLQPIVKRTQFQIIYKIGSGIVMESYPGPLGQVLTNLINNALIHGFENRTNGEIVISAHEISEQLLELVIADNGAGIAPEYLTRIYDPFFTTKLGHGGSGLGLHIVHNIVHTILLGKIKVKSEVNVGTEFTLTLPKKIASS